MIFINSKSEKITSKRHDYVSRAIIKIIIDEKLNENLRWIKFDEFKAKQKYIITGYESDLEENEINKLIEAMNNIDILTLEEKTDTNENCGGRRDRTGRRQNVESVGGKRLRRP